MSAPKKAEIGADRGFETRVGAEIGQNRHRESEAEGRPKGDGEGRMCVDSMATKNLVGKLLVALRTV